jgi:hypothetical protein
MDATPTTEHSWLERLVGEWSYETEAVMEPGAPPVKLAGNESVRSLGGLWVICEGRCEMPGGDSGTTIMTLGFDPARGCYVGTFVGSMMTHLWRYEGRLDPAGRVLTLDTEGPSFTAEGAMARYQDVIEIEDADHRTLASQSFGDDGRWHRFMTARYRRVT